MPGEQKERDWFVYEGRQLDHGKKRDEEVMQIKNVNAAFSPSWALVSSESWNHHVHYVNIRFEFDYITSFVKEKKSSKLAQLYLCNLVIALKVPI